MKKSLLLSLMMLLGAATPIMAQSSTDDYVPLVVEGAKWECDLNAIFHNNRPDWKIPYSIEIKGDTIIDNINYKCCVYTFEESSWTWEGHTNYAPAHTLTLAYIREDVENRKVYARSSDTQQHAVYSQFINFKESNGEFLLYDFANIDNPNQIWQKSYYPQGPHTLKAEKITIDGVERNCYAINNNGGYIIEGIGYDGKGYEQNSGDLMCQFPVFAAGTDNLPVFKAHKNASKQTIYQSGDAANVFNSVENIVTDLNAPTQYYNLQGVKVDKPQGGVFIKVQGDKATKMYIK